MLSTMLNQNILLYGQGELPPKPLPLRAGPLTMLFQPDSGFLRHIRFGDAEVVRSIYAVVRGNNWNTIPWTLRNLHSDVSPDSFSLRFEVECNAAEIKYVWRGEITGSAEGTVTFTFDGEARSDFLRNRIGICVLHPMVECAGQPCVVEHINGTEEHTAFPKQIAPWQPLRDVRAITFDLQATGRRVSLRFEGDVFETEDQRNYGDASFKTYGTPQDLPKPVPVKCGDRVQQKVTCEVRGVKAEVRAALPKPLTALPAPSETSHLPPLTSHFPTHVTFDRARVPKPALGLQSATDGERLTEIESLRIRNLRLAHLGGDIRFDHPDWRKRLRALSEEATALHLPLQLGLHLGLKLEEQLSNLVHELNVLRPPVGLWIVHHEGEKVPSSGTVQLAHDALASFTPEVPIASGASPSFTELNRNRPSAPDTLVSFPLTSQIHLRDGLTLVENIPAVTEQATTAATFLRRGVVVSPITLRRSDAKRGLPEALPENVDPRQMSLFAAAWTLAHISQLVRTPRLHSATYFETAGWRGIMERVSGSPAPSRFCSIPGAVFPTWHVFADLADAITVCPTHSTRPLEAAGLMVHDAQGRASVLLANLVPDDLEISVQVDGSEMRVRRLNADNAEYAMRSPEEFRGQQCEIMRINEGVARLRLSAYEVVRLDVL